MSNEKKDGVTYTGWGNDCGGFKPPKKGEHLDTQLFPTCKKCKKKKIKKAEKTMKLTLSKSQWNNIGKTAQITQTTPATTPATTLPTPAQNQPQQDPTLQAVALIKTKDSNNMIKGLQMLTQINPNMTIQQLNQLTLQ